MTDTPKRPIQFNVKGAQTSRMSGSNGPNQPGLTPAKMLPGNRAAASFVEELKKANEPKAG